MSLEFRPELHRRPNYEVHRFPRQRDPVSPHKVMVIPGLGNDATSYAVASDALYKMGFNVSAVSFLFDGPKEPKDLGLVSNPDKLKRDAIADAIQEEINADSLLGPSGQITLIAHSKGFIDTIEAAKSHPYWIKNLIGVAPLGLHERVAPTRILGAVRDLKAGEAKDTEDKKRIASQNPERAAIMERNDAIKEGYRKSNGMRFKREGITAAAKSVVDYLPELKATGMRIGILSMLDDSMAPSVTYEHLLTSEHVEERYRLKLSGIHGELRDNSFVAEAVGKLILEMERAA